MSLAKLTGKKQLYKHENKTLESEIANIYDIIGKIILEIEGVGKDSDSLTPSLKSIKRRLEDLE